MIDLFVKEAISDDEASLLLQYVFDLVEKKIVICSWDYLENNKVANSCECLAVKISITGDAQTLLQCYRIDIPLATFLERLQAYCKKKSVTCYVAANNFDDFYMITSQNEMIMVVERTDEESADNGEVYFMERLKK